MKKEFPAMAEARKESARRMAKTVISGLEKRGHRAYFAEDAQEALAKVLDLIPKEASVGVPGSVSIREIGAMEALQERGNRVVHHWDSSLSPEQKDEARFEEGNCDCLLVSSNAVTRDGILVNIDGSGNRVAAMSWSRGDKIFVISMNKVCPDLESAIRRARDIATPPNALRLGLKAPCAACGYHVGCSGEVCLCRVILLTEQAPNTPFGGLSHVILVGEDLGY